MQVRKDTRGRPPHRALAAALLLAGIGTAAAAEPFSAELSGAPGGGRGVAALMQSLRAASARQHRGASSAVPAGGNVLPVASCADDNGVDTLRSVVSAAASGDTLDLSALTCSAITLSQGAIPVLQDDLTLIGPGADHLALDGAGKDRVLIHYGYGTLTLRALTVRRGVNAVAGYKIAGGACILADKNVVLDHVAVNACMASGEGAYGGGMLAYKITLLSSSLSGNIAQGSLTTALTASYGGGAFAYFGKMSLYDSTVTGNRAQANSGNAFGRYDTGGGLFADTTIYLLRSTIEGNISDGTGGGAALHGALTAINSTVSGNSAGTQGGGVFVRTAASPQIANSTIAFNQAANGGGLYLSGVTAVDLQSSIVAANSAPSGPEIGCKAACAFTGANNLVRQAVVNATLPADTLHSDPLLLPLANNGGPTRTHALGAGSPAIDRGNNTSALASDQRGAGFPRVIGAAADIGAFENPQAAAAAAAAVPALGPFGAALLAGALLIGAALRRRAPAVRVRRTLDDEARHCRRHRRSSRTG